MAFANYLPPLQLVKPSLNSPKPSLFFNPSFFLCSHHFNFPSVLHNRSSISTLRKITVKAKPQEPEVSVATDAFTQFKHLLLPITDRKPYLSEGTKQALFGLMKRSGMGWNEVVFYCLDHLKLDGAEQYRVAIATTIALAKKYGADITVVVIDEQQKESLPEHETQLSSIRWHISEGGLKDYKMLERLGDGSKPTAIIGDVADELNLDLVVISMEAIHTKHIDANLLAEFIPCPVMLLPL